MFWKPISDRPDQSARKLQPAKVNTKPPAARRIAGVEDRKNRAGVKLGVKHLRSKRPGPAQRISLAIN